MNHMLIKCYVDFDIARVGAFSLLLEEWARARKHHFFLLYATVLFILSKMFGY